jgi:hypothetical protein
MLRAHFSPAGLPRAPSRRARLNSCVSYNLFYRSNFYPALSCCAMVSGKAPFEICQNRYDKDTYHVATLDGKFREDWKVRRQLYCCFGGFGAFYGQRLGK